MPTTSLPDQLTITLTLALGEPSLATDTLESLSTTYTKSEVNYRSTDDGDRNCSTCTNYHPSTRSCRIVTGDIKPDWVCDKWESLTSPDSASSPPPDTGRNAASSHRDT